jgi:hypothetical protein
MALPERASVLSTFEDEKEAHAAAENPPDARRKCPGSAGFRVP